MLTVAAHKRRVFLARDIQDERVLVKSGGVLVYVFFFEQDGDREGSLEITLSGRGARAKILGFNIGITGAAALKIKTIYEGKETAGHLWVKSVLGGDARSSVEGMIRIEKKARGADGYFTHNTLLLSPEAEAKTSPSLEIEANEVKASHSATVGHFDSETLFYLMCRGIKAEAAKKLVLTSFVSEYFSEIPEGKERAECERLLQEKIRALKV